MFAKKALAFSVALVTCLLCAATFAQERGTVPTIGDLSRIQAETLILKAKADRAKAQEELGGGAIVETGDEALPPVVSRIFGVGDKLKARFLFEGGSWVEQSAGGLIDGGYRIVVVTNDRVIVERKGKRTELAFSGQAPVRQKREEARAVQSPMGPYPMPTFPTPAPAPTTRKGG